MQADQILLSHKLADRASHQEPQCYPTLLPPDRLILRKHQQRLQSHLCQWGIVRLVGHASSEACYEFLHLSFQEYLAGRWLAHLWTAGREAEKVEAVAF